MITETLEHTTLSAIPHQRRHPARSYSHCCARVHGHSRRAMITDTLEHTTLSAIPHQGRHPAHSYSHCSARVHVPQAAPVVQPQMKAAKVAEFAYGLPGGANILGEFDPAGFLDGKDKPEVYKLREAELAHGRVGMLASLGFVVQEKFHPLFSGDGGPAIDQIPALPIWLWGAMLAGIGYCEQVRIARGWQKLDPKTQTSSSTLREGYYPGDLKFDPLGLAPEDAAEFRDMQEKELSHGRTRKLRGRTVDTQPHKLALASDELALTLPPLADCSSGLAMLASATFLLQEAVTGQTWGALWGDASF